MLAEKIENYYTSKELEEDIFKGLIKYSIDKCSDHLADNLKGFIQLLPGIDKWPNQEFFSIKMGYLTGRTDEFYEWFKNEYKSKMGISKKKDFGKIRYKHDDIAKAIISKCLTGLSEVWKYIEIADVLENYIIKQQAKVADNIDKETFPVDELETLVLLKRLDVFRNIYLTEKKIIKFSTEYNKNKHYELLRNRLERLQKKEIHVWNNIYSNFTRDNIFPAIKFDLPEGYKTTYDFFDYGHMEYIIYCRDIIEGIKETSFVKLMLKREAGSGMTEEEKNILKHFKNNNPVEFENIYSEVHGEQLHKYVKYTAMTSLVSMLDPLLKNICEQLNQKGFAIKIHAFNIATTYNSLKNECKDKKALLKFKETEALFEIFENIYSKSRGNIRNSILHLDGIDLFTPLYYYEELYLFVQNAYKILAELAKQEGLTMANASSHDQLSAADEQTINKYVDGFHWYILAGIIYKNVLAYMEQVLFNGNPKCMYFFISERHDINFLTENWELIYPDKKTHKYDIIMLYGNLKKAVDELVIKSPALDEIKRTDAQIIEGLKQINSDKVINELKQTVNLLINQITNKLSDICPSFSQLTKITTQGVRTEDKHEALLNITSSAIIIEKILLHLKQYQKLTGCIITKTHCDEQGSTTYTIKYKNMEIVDPKTSFVDEEFLQKTYCLITNIEHTNNTSDFNEFKQLLYTIENVRNISAHGGVEKFATNFSAIYSYIFFVVFRLMPISK